VQEALVLDMFDWQVVFMDDNRYKSWAIHPSNLPDFFVGIIRALTSYTKSSQLIFLFFVGGDFTHL